MWHAAALSLLIGCTGCQRQNNGSPTVEMEASLTSDELMHLVIEPAADVLWDSAGWVMTTEGEFSLVPSTDEEWLAAESAAGVIIVSGDLLKIPHPADEEREESWFHYASRLTEQGQIAQQAVLERDGDALFQAGADLYQACVQCHDDYWNNPQ